MTEPRKPKPIVSGGPAARSSAAKPAKAKAPAAKAPAAKPASARKPAAARPAPVVEAVIEAAPVVAVPVAPAPVAVAAPSPQPLQAPMSPAEREAARKAQSKRNILLGLSLVAFIIIVFLVTVLRMGGYVAQRPL